MKYARQDIYYIKNGHQPNPCPSDVCWSDTTLSNLSEGPF